MGYDFRNPSVFSEKTYQIRASISFVYALTYLDFGIRNLELANYKLLVAKNP